MSQVTPWERWYLELREALGAPAFPEPHSRAVRHARNLRKWDVAAAHHYAALVATAHALLVDSDYSKPPVDCASNFPARVPCDASRLRALSRALCDLKENEE